MAGENPCPAPSAWVPYNTSQDGQIETDRVGGVVGVGPLRRIGGPLNGCHPRDRTERLEKLHVDPLRVHVAFEQEEEVGAGAG